MLFNSLHFLVFFPVVCLVYFLLPSLRLRNLFLLIASYYFYMNWEPLYALLLFSSTFVTYASALGISHFANNVQRKKLCLTIAIVLNLGILFMFKYYAFAADNLTLLMAHFGIKMAMPEFSFLLPVGISFYIFQALGYSIDVYRGTTTVERNFFTYARFVSFFPQLVAGPIERSTNLLKQFKVKQAFSYDNVMAGIRLMLWGYFLKLVMADRCALYVDSVFNNVVHHNGGSYMLASLIFPFQIYGDFAGYSLTAIGAARVMGFYLMDNFHRPYLSKTVTEFWHRWHISLSTWFKDYVYIPLGGNRVNTPRCYANILITFVVSGIWHGANWTFLAWGTIHGTLQCIEKWLGWNKAKWNVATRFIHWLATFCIVALAWVFFRANTLADATTILSGIFTQLDKPFMLTNTEMALILFGIFAVFIKDCADEFKWPIAVAESKFWLVRHLYIVFMIAFIVMFGVLNGSQFIYFQF